jgi:hypothetical protein
MANKFYRDGKTICVHSRVDEGSREALPDTNETLKSINAAKRRSRSMQASGFTFTRERLTTPGAP